LRHPRTQRGARRIDFAYWQARGLKRLLKRQVRRVLRNYGFEINSAAGAPWPRDYFSSTFRPYRVKVPSTSDHVPRVLHVIGNFYTGGSSRLIVDLVERLGDRFAQAVLTRDVSSPPAYVGVKVETRPWLRNLGDAFDALSETRPDLVHVHHIGTTFSRIGLGDWDWYVNLFKALERLDRPVIENVNIPIAPYVSDAVSCYVFVSDYVREHFGHPNSRSLTIYPGSDVDTFRRGRNVDVSDDCVGMVYRLDGDKLDEHAIDVFVEVVKRRPGTQALIVGGGPLLSRYERAVAAAGIEDAFTFTGYVAYDDLHAHYQRMGVFVAPVHSESFGHVVPLAMSMGIPVAAYAVGALPEILADVSVLAPSGDATALAEIVCALLDDRDRRLALGAANRERSVERFSVEAMAERYAALYEELLSVNTR
jgi:glycosyltransferase involved in cell wall biosynthesis